MPHRLQQLCPYGTQGLLSGTSHGRSDGVSSRMGLAAPSAPRTVSNNTAGLAYPMEAEDEHCCRHRGTISNATQLRAVVGSICLLHRAAQLWLSLEGLICYPQFY